MLYQKDIMKKLLINFFIILGLAVALCGCGSEFTPLNVIFKDQTLKGSQNYAITAVYQEDKRIRDKYTDIYLQSDTGNLELKITKELGESYDITIPTANEWFSLTSLISQNLDLATFARSQTTTYVINAKEKAVLKFKAVGGELIYNLETGENKLENIFNVSDEFEVKIEKTLQNA